jgi:hypothetical protein
MGASGHKKADPQNPLDDLVNHMTFCNDTASPQPAQAKFVC